MAQDIGLGDFEKGDKIDLGFTTPEGERVTEEKTVRMVLPEKNAIVTQQGREMVKMPAVEGDSGAVESKLGGFRGFDPEIK